MRAVAAADAGAVAVAGADAVATINQRYDVACFVAQIPQLSLERVG